MQPPRKRRAAIQKILEMSDDEDEIALLHDSFTELVPVQATDPEKHVSFKFSV
mgnify:FL=1